MQIGIRLHDVNAGLAPAEQTMEARAAKAREEGFSCVHLALSKVMKDVSFDDCALTEGLAMHIKRVFAQNGLDIAVLGCYLNLAHPNPDRLRDIQGRYFGHLRAAALMGAGVVGTETGAPNAEYKMDANTHTREALETFVRNLAPVVERAERWGVAVAIEPVWKHIVYDADRALEVLNAIRSPNLRVILDPVNLLYAGNADDRERVVGEAMDKLAGRDRYNWAQYKLDLALTAAVREHMALHPDHFDPRQYLTPARAAIKEVVAHKMTAVLGCAGQA